MRETEGREETQQGQAGSAASGSMQPDNLQATVDSPRGMEAGNSGETCIPEGVTTGSAHQQGQGQPGEALASVLYTPNHSEPA